MTYQQFGNPMHGYQQPYFQQPVQDQLGQLRMQQYHQPMQLQQVTDPIWVVGIQGANAFLMAPNSRATLFDSTAPVFYVKSTDETGKPLPLEIFDYAKRVGEPAATNTADFVTRKEFEELSNAVKSLIPRKEDADA